MSEERTGEQAFLRLSCLPQPRLLLADTAHRGPRPCPPGQALERWNMGRPHSPARWMEGTPRYSERSHGLHTGAGSVPPPGGRRLPSVLSRPLRLLFCLEPQRAALASLLPISEVVGTVLKSEL